MSGVVPDNDLPIVKAIYELSENKDLKGVQFFGGIIDAKQNGIDHLTDEAHLERYAVAVLMILTTRLKGVELITGAMTTMFVMGARAQEIYQRKEE